MKICKVFLLPTVATYPSVGGQCEGSQVRLPSKENMRSRHQRLFEKNVGKTGKMSSNIENKGSGVVYAWGRY